MSYEWKNVLLPPTATILEALDIINKEALRVALVVDKDRHLVGVVTDGDIRRGLLKNLSLTDHIALVMNTTPCCANLGTSRADLVDLMKSKGILSVPLLDGGRVVGLETLPNALSRVKHQNPVFIMAGGFGSRLRPLTDHCPKPMLKVGGKPILETQLNHFVKEGFKNIFISTHFMPEQITDYFGDGSAWGANIRYIHEDAPLGTGGSLGLLPDDVPDLPLIMINGDVLTTVDFELLLDFHNRYQPVATMCVREYDYQIPYGVVNGDGHRILKMQEKPIQRFFVNAGIYIVSPALFKTVPSQLRIDMPTLLEQQLAKQEQVLMFPIHEYWRDIGRMDDYQQAQIDILELV